MSAPVLFLFGGVRRNSASGTQPSVTLVGAPLGPLGKALRVYVIADLAADPGEHGHHPKKVAEDLIAALRPKARHVAMLQLRGRGDANAYDVDDTLRRLGGSSKPVQGSVADRLRRTPGPVAISFETGTQAQIAALVELCGVMGLETWAVWLDGKKPRAQQIMEAADATDADGGRPSSLRAELEHLAHLPPGRTLLLVGESGTGKSHRAKLLHDAWATRWARKGPYREVNCAALPETLLESELFGHAKGAFTGAAQEKRGLFEECNDGTLLLDEIGEMPLALQAKLLLVLQLGEDFRCRVRPLGETKPRFSDVRILFATNRDLSAKVRAGEFREDLLARISTHVISLAPLRERRHELLAGYLRNLNQISNAYADGAFHWERAAWRALTDFVLDPATPWSWNHRDVGQSVERLAFDAWSAQGYAKDSSGRVTLKEAVVQRERALLERRWASRVAPATGENDEWAELREALAPGTFDTLTVLERWEARHLHAALKASDGNRAAAWRQLVSDQVFRDGSGNASDAFKKRWAHFAWSEAQ